MTERHFIPLATPFEVTLAGTRLVEAGAGTGKTWTITALVLRLLLEQDGEIGQILVVTYTRAAIGELRGRIRSRLIEALAAFDRGATTDAFLQMLLARHDPARARARLRLAIESFDEAAIFTIHGFCQRALADTAFEAGQPFERELLADAHEMLAGVARDAWRREMAGASLAWGRWLIGQFGGPAGLAECVKAHVGRVDAQILAPVGDDRQAAESALAAAGGTARRLWQAEGAAILDWIDRAGLHKGSYTPEKMQPRILVLERFFAGETVCLPLPEELVYFGREKIEAKRTQTSPFPEHAFFGAIDALLQAAARLAAAFDQATRRLAHDFLLTARTELAAQKRRSGQQGYDDLLADLARALQGPAGAALAGNLRGRYRAALVDEFQDTDPLQLAIFSGVFGAPDRPLVFVGDPKQAIYGFRGADVFAYLAARQQADAGYALLENRRSVPGLLTALNALFDRPRPFLLDALPFDPAIAATMTRRAFAIDDGAAPLTLWALEKPAEAKTFTKESATAHVADAVAADIARLLALSAMGRAQLDGRALGGGDIAVLVRKRFQGETVRQALARHGIASVTVGGGSIWHSEEAEEMERLLLAVAAPTHEGLVRAALATVLLGVDAARLMAWRRHEDRDAAGWGARLERWHDDLALCREHGFMALWRRLLRREGVVERVLARPDGARRMTNYRHLAELLQAAEHAGTLDAAGLARYIAQARARPEAEENQLRLESDAQLVRIVTIHAAKGLQYPIVYCPFLWDGPQDDATGWPVLAHDRPGNGSDSADTDAHAHGGMGAGSDTGGQACLDFGSSRIDALRRQAELESAAEELRLAYVALTRAEQRCIVAWGKVNRCERSPLAWLLFGPRAADGGDPRRLLAEKLEKLDAAALLSELQTLADGLAGAMSIVAAPASVPGSMAGGSASPPALAPRAFSGNIPPPWRIASFSALTARLTQDEISDREVAPDRDAVPGHAALAALVVSGGTGTAPPVPTFAGIFDFPRGTRAGSCLHALLERVDFQARDGQGPLAAAVLAEFGFPVEWQPVLERLVADVVAAPLDDGGARGTGGVSLAQVARGERLIELEFVFPLRSVAGQAGYMKGFIDLVFRHGGRWYIVDYKSNWLGNRPEDYARPQLEAAMRAHRYDLQLLIYAAALKRALAWREPDIEWSAAFGGVFYLFLRGMGLPASTGVTGVYFARPDEAAIDALLDGVEA